MEDTGSCKGLDLCEFPLARHVFSNSVDHWAGHHRPPLLVAQTRFS